MKTDRIVRALIFALLSTIAVLTPANLLAQTTDPALNAFQVTVPINIDNFNFTAVTIPAGQRLYPAASQARLRKPDRSYIESKNLSRNCDCQD